MEVKKMVKRGGRWVEAYVSMGPGRARPAHGLPKRVVDGQRIGPARLGTGA
jgi:hypothetical protein